MCCYMSDLCDQFLGVLFVNSCDHGVCNKDVSPRGAVDLAELSHCFGLFFLCGLLNLENDKNVI